MISNCPTGDELLGHLEKDVSVVRASEIEEHFRQCQVCARRWTDLKSIAGRIVSDPGEFYRPDFVERVVRHVTSGRVAQRPRPRAMPWLWSLAASALAASLVGVWIMKWAPVPGETARFAARGGTAFEPNRWVSFQVFGSGHDGKTYVRVNDAIDPGERLVFSVHNGVPSPYRFVMIFGVQDFGAIFWYYPAYDRASDFPQSVAVAQEDNEQFLGEEIRHALRPGTLRIFALFSVEPFDVATVERLVEHELSIFGDVATMGLLPVDNIGQQSMVIRVREGGLRP